MTDDSGESPQQVATVPVVPPSVTTGQGAATDVPVPPSPSQAGEVALDEQTVQAGAGPARTVADLAQAPLKAPSWRDQAFTPGKLDVDHGSDAPTDYPAWQSVLSAEFQKNNMIGSLVSSDYRKAPTHVQPGYNPWDEIKGTPYESRWERFADLTNPAIVAAVKRDIDREQANDKVLSLAPWWQTMPFGVAAGVADPTILMPGGAFVKGAKGGLAIGRAALSVGAAAGAASAVQEAGLHATQQTRTMEESLENVGASVLLGAALGAGGAAVLSREQWQRGVAGLERDVANAGAPPSSPSAVVPGMPQEVGAAAVAVPKLDDLAIAGRVAGGVAKATEFLNPLLRLTQSESPVVRDVAANLIENPLYLKQNMRGVASPQAAETGMKEFQGGLADAIRSEREAWKDYRKNGGDLTLARFQEEVGKALRRNDESDIAQVASVAKMYRSKVFDPPKEHAINLGLLPQDVSTDTAPSYFSRIYNRNRMNGEEQRFKDIVSSYYAGAMKNDFVDGSKALTERLARLDQERADLGLPAEARAATLAQIDARLEEIGRNQAISDAADRLVELRGVSREARSRGDAAAAQTARDEMAALKAQGGDALAEHVAETSRLRSRRQSVSMNTAGLAERADRIVSQIADQAEANERSMARLVRKGQQLQREIQRLDPEKLQERVGQLRDGFAAQAKQAERAAERIRTAAKQEAVGKAPQRPRGGNPETLRAFLWRAGGVKDEGGNLKAAGLNRGLASEKGLSPNRAREMAAEAGYLGHDIERAVAETTPNDLIDALQSHPTYSVHDQALVDAKFYHARDVADRKAYGEAYDRLIARLKEEHGIAEGDLNHLALKDATDRFMGGEDPLQAYETSLKEATDRQIAGQGTGNLRLDKLVSAEQAKANRLYDIAERLNFAENFDRQGALDEINAAVKRLQKEVSGVSLRRGEERARLTERLAKLDPARVEERLKRIDRMRRETERRFYDRWEINRQGQKLDLENPHTADFSEMGRDIASHVFDTLTGRGGEEGLRPEFMKINIRGPMKDRTLNIPDELIEDFLEHNSEMVARRYTRTMGADIELTRKFGSPDMSDAFRRVKEDYAKMRQGATDEKRLIQIAKAERADLLDLSTQRDLLRGTFAPSAYERNFGRVVRTVNNLNYIRKMGKVVVASLGDAARPAMVHGLAEYMATMPQLITNLRGVRMAAHEAQLAGNITERVLSHKMATLTEMTDPYATRGPIESFTHNLTQLMNKANGIRIWTDGMKTVASTMTQNRILRNAERMGGKVKDRERTYMAYLGLDESMTQRIAAQFAEHGEQIQGVRVANTEDWTDAVARRAYRAAMNKDMDSIIVQPGVADVPVFAHTATGKMMLQFKTFTLASHQRVLLRGLQEEPSRFVSGMIALTAIGMMTRYLQALSGNNLERIMDYGTKPGEFIGEGLDAGGGLALLMELANTFEKFTSINPIKAPLAAGDPKSYRPPRAPDPTQLLTGPAGGLFHDFGLAAYGARQKMQGKPVTRASEKAALNLLPFSTVFGIQEIINHLVLPPPRH